MHQVLDVLSKNINVRFGNFVLKLRFAVLAVLLIYRAVGTFLIGNRLLGVSDEIDLINKKLLFHFFVRHLRRLRFLFFSGLGLENFWGFYSVFLSVAA